MFLMSKDTGNEHFGFRDRFWTERRPFVSDWIQAGVGKEGLEWGQGSENAATERGGRRAWARR